MAYRAISVSQLNQYIKRIMEHDPILEDLTVIGEISNVKYHGSGHVYFTLKDKNSKINCFLPWEFVKNVQNTLSDGMEVSCSGKISVVEKSGYYSLFVKHVDIHGEGQLAVAFERLKKKLLEEGLFDSSHKKELPAFPQKIGVITSSEGAAVKDIVKIITSKNTYVDILIFPCLVQGPFAPEDIAENIRLANTHNDIDVLIVGRGGGSLEELFAFNEEIVARSIFESRIPVISAVGHETDVTISDFVADMRAETPTAAAEMAVPNTYVLLEHLVNLKKNMLEFICNAHNKKNEKLKQLYSELKFNINLIIGKYEIKLEHLSDALEILNPGNVLNKGYSITLDKNGNTVRSINDVNIAETITTILPDGSLMSDVKERE